MNDATESTPKTINADLGPDGPERVYLCAPASVVIVVNSAVRRG